MYVLCNRRNLVIHNFVKNTLVFLTGINSMFLKNRVNLILRVRKHSWDGSIELRFYIKSFFERTEELGNFQGTFL